MNLGPRCNAMLANSTQCPNTVQEGSDMCKLHYAIEMYGTSPREIVVLDNDSTGLKQE